MTLTAIGAPIKLNDTYPQNLLCSDAELEYLKRAIKEIDEATATLKRFNDQAVRATPAFRDGKPIRRDFSFYD